MRNVLKKYWGGIKTRKFGLVYFFKKEGPRISCGVAQQQVLGVLRGFSGTHPVIELYVEAETTRGEYFFDLAKQLAAEAMYFGNLYFA